MRIFVVQLARSIGLPPGVEFPEVVQDVTVRLLELLRDYDADPTVAHGSSGPIDRNKWLWVRTLGDVRDQYRNLYGYRRKAKTLNVGRARTVFDRNTRIASHRQFNTVTDEPVAAAVAAEERETLEAAIAKLSPTKQRAVRAYYYENLKQHEIAEREAVSGPAVSRRLSDALEELRSHLGNP